MEKKMKFDNSAQTIAHNEFLTQVFASNTRPELWRKYDFQHDCNQAKTYEDKFRVYMLGKGIPPGQIKIAEGNFKDWDVKIFDVTYEIKRDYWYVQTQNILIEMWYDVEAKKQGWFQYSKADKLVVWVSDDMFYVIDMKSLRAQFQLDSEAWKVVLTPQKGAKFHTLNYITRLANIEVDSWINVNHKEVQK
jgi:hypothetical protein